MAKESSIHIGIFGRRNCGKSSLINSITGQDIAIVSDIPGTTTDPVKKSIEILGIGPCVVIDTAGIDDEGNLGKLRIKKTIQVIQHIDIAILMIAYNQFGDYEKELISLFKKYKITFILIHNKNDIEKLNIILQNQLQSEYNTSIIDVSLKNNNDTNSIIEIIKEAISTLHNKRKNLLEGLVSPKDIVLLVVPIDTEAPEGRLILPQVQTIRSLLDNHCIAITLKETELAFFLNTTLIKPKIVITDSSIFNTVAKIIPLEIPLTGFSILLARHKGPFSEYIKGVSKISNLKDGDKVLILESCTHQVSCDDIGRYKLPQWIKNYTGQNNIIFEVISGLGTITRDITEYAIVIQCGGCMITEKQIFSRLKDALDNNIPITNYGLAIAYLHGIFERAIEPFKSLSL